MEDLVEASFNEDFTQIDHLQMARLKTQLGDLAYKLNDIENALKHYKDIPQLLEKAGINLTLAKWMERISLRAQVPASFKLQELSAAMEVTN